MNRGNTSLFRRCSLFLIVLCLAGATACTRDINVRKQKYLASGNQYFDKQRYQEATIQYLNAIKLDSTYGDAHFKLAQCYLKLGYWTQAYGELLQTVEIQPDNLEASLELARLQALAGRYLDARERATKILEKEPKNVNARVVLASSQAALGNMDTALKEMERALQQDPNRADLYEDMATLQVRAGQFQEAEANYKKSLSLDPNSSASLLALAGFYGEHGRVADAEAMYRHAIELKPKDPARWNAFARMYITHNEIAKAEQLMIEAKKAMPDVSTGYRMLGDFYVTVGQLGKGLAEYASLYKEHPRDLQLKYSYVQVLIMNNRLDEATRVNDAILDDNKKDAEALVLRSKIQIAQGRTNDAIATLQNLISLEPDKAVGHVMLAQLYERTGAPDRAEAEIRAAVRYQPNLADAQRALARISIARGDLDQVQQSAEVLIRVEPKSPDGYVWRAMVESSRGDQTSAEADLKRAIDVAPNNSMGYTQLGVLRLMQKRTAEGEKLLDQALQISPGDTDALRDLVSYYLQMKQPDKALARVRAQIAKAPNASGIYSLEGILLFSQKKLDEAEAAFQKASDLDSNNMDAQILIGQVQVARGSLEKAIASYQRDIQEHPLDSRFYFLAGLLEEQRGNWSQAEQYYRQALNVKRDHAGAANNLAYLMLEHGGNLDVALSLAQIGRQGMPDSPNSADTLGWAYYRKGAYALAINLFQEALKKQPNDAAYHYHLGMTYLKTGDKQQARTHLERALQLNPKFDHAAEARSALAQT